MPMNVEISHHIDASDPNPEGFYDYHYEYDIYVFSDGPLSYVVRAYTDQPVQAAFMSVSEGSGKRLLRSRDFRRPLFAEAVAYLRNAGKTDLSWLSEKRGGYFPIADTDDGRQISRLWRLLWRTRHTLPMLTLLMFVAANFHAGELPALAGRVVDACDYYSITACSGGAALGAGLRNRNTSGIAASDISISSLKSSI